LTFPACSTNTDIETLGGEELKKFEAIKRDKIRKSDRDKKGENFIQKSAGRSNESQH